MTLPADPSAADAVSLRVYLEAIADERDARYAVQFAALGAALDSAIGAQKEAMHTAFRASELATTKSEEAQAAYNERSNEFRGALDDQAKLLITRNEAAGMIRENVQTFEAFKNSYEDRHSVLQNQVDDLRLSKAELQGKASQSSVNVAQLISIIALVIGLVTMFDHLLS